MAHPLEKKLHVLEVLDSKANGDISKCSHLTGVDRKTIRKWKEEADNTKKEESGELPTCEEIKEKIIRRIYAIIGDTKDPKKLAETYKAISEFEKEGGKQKTSLFEIIEQQLDGTDQ